MASISNSSGSFCSAFGCSNNKSRQSEKHFFRFPKDKERCKRWVINCRREDLQKKEWVYLNQNCRLCDDHFTPNQFMNGTKEKLVWNAVPTLFPMFGSIICTNQRKPPKNRPAITSSNIVESLDSSVSLSRPIQNDHSYCDLVDEPLPKKQQIPSNANCLATKIVELQRKLHVASDPIVEQPISIDQIIDASISHGMQPASAEFFRTQLLNCSRKSKGHRWTLKDKRVALGIFFKSRQAYRTLCSLFIMPSPCTLNRFVRGIPTSPGLCASVLQLLQVKARYMDELSKTCVVTFDEMSLKKDLRYNSSTDEVDGLVHLTERQPVACNQALVFMVRGLTRNWKQPIAFYFSNNAASAPDLRILLHKVLEALVQVSLKPTVVVCDQGSCNRALYRLLGVTENLPFFQFNQQRIYAVHDVPHSLKNVRNNLKKQDIEFDKGKLNHLVRLRNMPVDVQEIASWADIVSFYKQDVELPVRMAPKLTTKHIFLPPFSPMRVNLAAQVCSHSVYAGIQTLVALGRMPAAASNTAQFLKDVNDVFDFLNVRSFKTTKNSRPLTGSENDVSQIAQFRHKVELWTTATTGKQLPCFQSLLQSLNATELMLKELVIEGKFKFLLTGRVNQDCIENLFSQVRAKGGHRFNPSAQEFGFAYRCLCTNMIMAPVQSSNCKDSDDALLSSLHEMSTRSLKRTATADDGHEFEPPNKRCKVLTKQQEHLIEIIDDFELPTKVVNIVNYIGGYVLRKLQVHYKCPACMSGLTKKGLVIEEADFLCHFKAYKVTSQSAFGSLLVPSVCLSKYLQRVEKMFQKHIPVKMASKKLFIELISIMQQSIPFQLLKLCSEHYNAENAFSILKCCVKCRLHYYFKFETRKLMQVKSKANRKAHILQHK